MSGKEALVTLTNIRENTNKIKNKVMVFLIGKMGACIRETMLMI